MAIAGELAINLVGDISGLKGAFNKAKGQTKSLQDSLKKTSQKIGNFGSSMTRMVTGPLLAAGAGIAATAKHTANYAKEVQRASDATGASIAGFQELRYAMSQLGIESDEAKEMLIEVNRVMGEAAAGDEDMAQRLKAVGLSMEDLRNMNTDEAFMRIVEGLRNMDSQAQKTAISGKLLGEDLSMKLLPALNKNSKSIRALRKEAQELGLVMGEEGVQFGAKFAAELKKLKLQAMGLVRELGEKFIPVFMNQLLPIIEGSIIPAIKSLIDMVGNLAEAFGALPQSLQKFVIGLTALVGVVGPIAVGISAIVSAFATLAPIIAGVGSALATFISIVTGVAPVLAIVAGAITGAIAVWTLFGDKIKESAKQTYALISGAFKKLANVIPSLIGSIKQSIIGGWDTVINFFKGLPDRFYQFGKDAIQGFIDGIKNLVMTPVRLIENMASDVTEAAKDILNIGSPSKEFMNIGEDVVRGLNQGIENQMDNLRNKSLEMSAQIQGNFDNDQLQPSIPGGSSGNNGPAIYIDKMEVRDEKDIDNLEERFKSLERRRNRRVQQ